LTDPGGSVTFFGYWSRSRGRCFIGERSQDGDGARTVVRRALDLAGGRIRRLAAVLVAGLVLGFGASSAEAVPSVTFKCTPAPEDCSGWYRSNVSIDWTVLPSGAARAGCQDKTFTTDTPGTSEYCSANDGTATVTVELTIRVDKTPPVVTGGHPSRSADVNGWYNHAVAIAFSGSDQTSGIESCTATSYGGPDSAAASVTGICQDRAGNLSSPFGYGLRYDQTAPLLMGATPERPPNAGGWFNRPVRFDIQATDATSGIADCPSVTYGGPDSAAASVSAGCRDQAGNSASRSFALKYDATAPVLRDLKASGLNRGVALSWRTGADTESVEVVRTPGVGGEPATTVFRGLATSFVDGRVTNGVRYTYEVRAEDAADNAASQTTSGVPVATGPDAAPPGPTARTPAGPRAGRRRRLIAPRAGALVRPGRPPLLRWTPVRGARYYNLQLWRRGAKILSVWPARARFQLKRRWRYGGRSWRLEPGRYRWFVWPGFGPRSKADYGRRMGPGRFEVRRGGSTRAVRAGVVQ
jgi:hypothetical protein